LINWLFDRIAGHCIIEYLIASLEIIDIDLLLVECWKLLWVYNLVISRY